MDISEVSEAIIDIVDSGKPSMIARFGSVEIKGVLYPMMPTLIRAIFKNRVFNSMYNNAGFFSISDEEVGQFSSIMIEDMKQLDVLGSWRLEEKLLNKNYPNATKVKLSYLEPYLSLKPWSQSLVGKKVLVVHPFNKTIEQQYYSNRAHLFSDKNVLPEFRSLKVVKAVQTIAGTKSEFANWFEALDFMKSSIDVIDYDVAILGCGAYGFPLAAHIKRMGKTAIHLGGATQILFGIKGKRWDNHPVISSLYNDYWVRPSSEDIPTQADKVEQGCYW